MKKISMRILIITLFTFTGALFAQSLPETSGPSLNTDVVKIYFFLIVLATVISRVLEYLKSVLEWLWPKVGFLTAFSNAIWNRIRYYLDHMHMVYDETEARALTMHFLTSLIIHTFGVALGVFFCVQFELGMVDKLGIQNIDPVLNSVISGIAAGLGIDAVHSVFRMAEEKRRLKKLYNTLSR